MPLTDFVTRLSGIFSRRTALETLHTLEDLSSEARFRIVSLVQTALSQTYYGSESDTWARVHHALQQIYGRPILSNEHQSRSPRSVNISEDLLAFLSECKTEHFFDFIEVLFHSNSPWEELGDLSDLTDAMSVAFSFDGSAYRVTPPMYREEVPRSGIPSGPPLPPEILRHPSVIKIEEDVAFEEAVKPALEILSQPHFQVADGEFRDALRSYRNGRYADCLTHCGSSLESVLKVICSRKGFHYDERDTASTLIATVVPGLKMEGFFTQPWTLLATLRNRLSSSHGGGTKPRAPEHHFAQYGLTSIAAVIVLVVTVAESKP